MQRFLMSNRKLCRRVFYVICLAGGLACASGAYAECRASYPFEGNDYRVYDGPAEFKINPKDPVNTVLFTYSVTFPRKLIAECGLQRDSMYLYGAGDMGPDGVMKLSEDIGWRLYRNGTLITSRPLLFPIGPGRVYAEAATYKIDVIKLKQPTSNYSTRLPWLDLYFWLNVGGGYVAKVHNVEARNWVKVAPLTPTCTVSTRSVAIDLGAVAASSLTSVGSVSPTSGTQNVSLSCSNNPSVTMTMSGTRSGTLPNVLALTLASTARGVGVQILRNNAALTIGSGVSVSSGAGATLTVPIAARYYRTGDITAGTANASATLQFTYN